MCLDVLRNVFVTFLIQLLLTRLFYDSKRSIEIIQAFLRLEGIFRFYSFFFASARLPMTFAFDFYFRILTSDLER